MTVRELSRRLDRVGLDVGELGTEHDKGKARSIATKPRLSLMIALRASELPASQIAPWVRPVISRGRGTACSVERILADVRARVFDDNLPTSIDRAEPGDVAIPQKRLAVARWRPHQRGNDRSTR